LKALNHRPLNPPTAVTFLSVAVTVDPALVFEPAPMPLSAVLPKLQQTLSVSVPDPDQLQAVDPPVEIAITSRATIPCLKFIAHPLFCTRR
jgi:hypothetical protein